MSAQAPASDGDIRGLPLALGVILGSMAIAAIPLVKLALQFILKAGGSGHFRAHAVAPHLRSGRLRLVSGAPEFLFPAYAVYSVSADPKIVMPALAGLRHVAFAAKRSGAGTRRPRASSNR